MKVSHLLNYIIKTLSWKKCSWSKNNIIKLGCGALGRLGYKDHKFKVSLDYKVNSRPVLTSRWDPPNPPPNSKTEKKNTEQYIVFINLINTHMQISHMWYVSCVYISVPGKCSSAPHYLSFSLFSWTSMRHVYHVQIAFKFLNVLLFKKKHRLMW